MTDNTVPKSAEEPEKLDLGSHHIADDKKAELLRLFPEIRTEGGKIDFDQLRRVLGETVDPGRERYGMTWPGKADCFKTIQQPSLGTLLPCREESVNFDTTENLVIEGDNLEVLKLLQKSYLGKVKMIYIDPPYNTGNEFIYPDNFSESLQTYLEYSGQLDHEGRKFSTNSETDGRFHSRWLNMMYPRLYLARNLLRADGVIFISIDDHEVDNLRKLCSEVFGEENFIANVIWQKMYAPKSSARHFSEDHDYVMIYARDAEEWRPSLLPRTEAQDRVYKNFDKDPRGPWRPNNLAARNYYSKGTYPITCPSGRQIEGPPKGSYWRVSESKFRELDKDNRIWWGEDGNNIPAPKIFLSEVKPGRVPQTLWSYSDVGHNQEAKKQMLELIPFEDSEGVFDTPKPSRLIKRAIGIGTDQGLDDIVLDFFAGSGTTAQAVMEMNREDGGNRRFVLVQLPEPTGRTDYSTIAEITKARVRASIQRIQEDRKSELISDGPEPDLGFRTLKLAESSFRSWKFGVTDSKDELPRQLELHADHLKAGRVDEEILFELLLKSGFQPTTKVETLSISGKSVYSVADGAMLICLDRNLTHELLKGMAELQPQRVVCLDAGFAGNDQLKTNAVQIMKAKGVTSFRTV